MKWLFALLLLANIAYFLWQFAGPPRAQETATAHAPRAEIHPDKLKRLTEPGVSLQPRARAAPEAPGAAGPTPVPTTAPPVHTQCYTIGPFASVDAQTLAGLRLQELGLSYLERTQAQTEPVYRVFEGPFINVGAAERRRRQLTRQGIAEHTLTSDGDNRYTIALGLFVQAENAQAAQRELTARGARPKLVQGKRAVTAYWLDTHALAPASAEALKKAWDGIPGVAVNEKTCPAPAAESGNADPPDAQTPSLPSLPAPAAAPAAGVPAKPASASR